MSTPVQTFIAVAARITLHDSRKAVRRTRYQRQYARRRPALATPRPTVAAPPLKPVGKRIPLAYLRAVWGVSGSTVWDRKQAKAAQS